MKLAVLPLPVPPKGQKSIVGHTRLPMLVVLVERHRGTLRQDHVALLIAGRQRPHLLLSRPLLGLILRCCAAS